MTNRGLTSWTDDLSARERVREIATTLTEARSVEWVREQADVSSWQTAKDELEMLVEFGQLHAIEGDDGHIKYAPNYQRRYFDEVAELINERSRDELRDAIASVQEEIDEWRDTYDVESRDELESSLVEADLTGPEIRARNEVLREWEHRADTKRLLRHALELYDDARSLHPASGDETDPSVSVPN